MTSVMTMAKLTLTNHLLSVHLDRFLTLMDESVPDVDEGGVKSA